MSTSAVPANPAVQNVMQKLARNRMKPYYVERKEDVLPLLSELIPAGSTVGTGGSISMNECGVMDYLRSGPFRFLDRYRPGLTKEEGIELRRQSLLADVFLAGCNAITADGALVNADGMSNRVAAIAFGPKSVILIAGINKLVADEKEALLRIRTVAAPRNAKENVKADTPCSHTGRCAASDGAISECGFAAGCFGTSRICCNYLVSAYQRVPDRIKVILVGEPLGY